MGRLVSEASDFGSGRDLTDRGFKPRVRLRADSSDPGACFRFCVSLSPCPSPARALSLILSLKNKTNKKDRASSRWREQQTGVQRLQAACPGSPSAGTRPSFPLHIYSTLVPTGRLPLLAYDHTWLPTPSPNNLLTFSTHHLLTASVFHYMTQFSGK